ncbi:MAG: fibro-slime domain-containing protein [Planctomycetota bacterium]|jgi:fibro-slime domain-containing protein
MAALVGLLGLACVQDAGAEPSETIVLSGTVRDFRQAHVDFKVEPPQGTGHCAGNIDLGLGVEDRPAFTGSGFKLASQWRNAGGEPIPPHLYLEAGGPGAVRVAEAPNVDGNATFDSWDSSLGPYGGENVGPAPEVEVGAPMRDIPEPGGLGPSVGDTSLDDATLNGDLHCDSLTINGTVVVSGRVTVLCEADFTMAAHSALELAPGATLALYVKKAVTILPHANLNANPGLPGLVTIYVLGDQELRISQPLGVVYAVVVAPNAHMQVMPNAEFFGAYVGKSLEVKANAGFHVDGGVALPVDVCGNLVNDSTGSPAMHSTGAIHSADSFDQWYRDDLGVSLSAAHSITLIRDHTGVYEYSDSAFYPIDGVLFGNEGDAHNYYFTYAITAQFEYKACGGQFIEFKGSDDAWMFVNDVLALDLGGIVPGTEQVVELDRLGLRDGEVIELRFFFAHRYPAPPAFNLWTNVELLAEAAEDTASFPCD